MYIWGRMRSFQALGTENHLSTLDSKWSPSTNLLTKMSSL